MQPLAAAKPLVSTYFSTAAAVPAWLENRHTTATEPWVGFFVKRQEHDA